MYSNKKFEPLMKSLHSSSTLQKSLGNKTMVYKLLKAYYSLGDHRE